MKSLRDVAKNPRVTVVTEPGFEPYLDGDDQGGAFRVAAGGGVVLSVIASNMEGWDHVSVSLPDRTPTWDEMERVKRIFFKDGEIAHQLHLPVDQHINVHPYTLHIWRMQSHGIPVPPRWMV